MPGFEPGTTHLCHRLLCSLSHGGSQTTAAPLFCTPTNPISAATSALSRFFVAAFLVALGHGCVDALGAPRAAAAGALCKRTPLFAWRSYPSGPNAPPPIPRTPTWPPTAPFPCRGCWLRTNHLRPVVSAPRGRSARAAPVVGVCFTGTDLKAAEAAHGPGRVVPRGTFAGGQRETCSAGFGVWGLAGGRWRDFGRGFGAGVAGVRGGLPVDGGPYGGSGTGGRWDQRRWSVATAYDVLLLPCDQRCRGGVCRGGLGAGAVFLR